MLPKKVIAELGDFFKAKKGFSGITFLGAFCY
jgi:hypothetical protein